MALYKCDGCGEYHASCTCMDDSEQECSGQVDCSSDAVHAPSHYMLFDNLESIEVIARTMTVSEYRGFCLGNVLKYRLRAGKKADLANTEQDLKKAEFYKELFEKHKGLCHE